MVLRTIYICFVKKKAHKHFCVFGNIPEIQMNCPFVKNCVQNTAVEHELY